MPNAFLYKKNYSFRIEGKDQPNCDECSVSLTVHHIISECVEKQVQREIILSGINSIEEIFNHSDKDIIEFLRECDLVNQLSTSNSQHTLHRNMFQTYCILPEVYYFPYPMETTMDKLMFISK